VGELALSPPMEDCAPSSPIACAGCYEVVVDFDAWATDLIRGRTVARQPGAHGIAGRLLATSVPLEQYRGDGEVGSELGHARHRVRPKALAERIGRTAEELMKRYSTDG